MQASYTAEYSKYDPGKSLGIIWTLSSFFFQVKCTLTSLLHCHWGLAWWLNDKEFTCSAGDGDPGSIPGSGRSPGKGNGNPLQYSFLENPIGRGVWRATVLGVTKSLVHTACGKFVFCKKQGTM